MATKAKPRTRSGVLVERGGDNVFADLGFDRGGAANLRLRSELMLRVERYVRESGATQNEAARVLGITQPRLNALLKGRIDLFSLDALVNMLTRAGIDVELKLRKAA